MAGLFLLWVAILHNAASFPSSRCCKKLSLPELVYSFVTLDFDFGSEERRQAALDSGQFILKNNFFSRIESYRGDIYLTVPRFLSGVPFTLVKLVEKADGTPILEPFPGKQTIGQQPGNCGDIIQCFSFKIDIHTDTMWAIDSGRILFPDENDPLRSALCPAKLLAIKVRSRRVIFRHIFPDSVVPIKTNFINDLVLDYVNGHLAFIYIPDTASFTLVVYDVKQDQSFLITHPSFRPDPAANLVNFPGDVPPFFSNIGINGVALSCDFRFFYYRSFTGFDFFRIPTLVLRNGGRQFDDKFQFLGRRSHIANAMVYSTKHNLYYAATNESAIDRWLIGKDAMSKRDFRDVCIQTVQRIAQDFQRLEFPDSVSINEEGFLYFTAVKGNRVVGNFLDITGRNGTNFHIWRIKLNRGERSYLWRANRRTARWRKTVSRSLDMVTAKWQMTCSRYNYVINRWAFFNSVHNLCWVITPIRATRCATKSCRWVWEQPYFNYYRCMPRYSRVSFWAFCPDSPEGKFHLLYRKVPTGCYCRRFVCPIITIRPRPIG